MKAMKIEIAGHKGFTLIEMLLGMGAAAIVGTILFTILHTGMILFAKNTAINLAHQQARIAVMQMEQDIHGAVSVPQLTDATRTLLTGSAANGPSAGISFQLWAAGPFQVAADTAAGSSTISIKTNGFAPSQYQRLIIPGFQVEMDIINQPTAGTNVTLSVGTAPPPTGGSATAGTIPVAVNGASGGNIACFITDRVYYVVQNSQLTYYGRQTTNSGNYKVLANDITTATPFSVPSTPMGAPYTRFVAAINLSTSDGEYSNLHFKAANMFLNALEPTRSTLCQFQ